MRKKGRNISTKEQTIFLLSHTEWNKHEPVSPIMAWYFGRKYVRENIYLESLSCVTGSCFKSFYCMCTRWFYSVVLRASWHLYITFIALISDSRTIFQSRVSLHDPAFYPDSFSVKCTKKNRKWLLFFLVFHDLHYRFDYRNDQARWR